MRWRGRQHLWERYEVWDNWLEGWSSCEVPNRHQCSHTITDNIWKVHTDSWNRLRTSRNVASDVLTGQYPNLAGFGDTSGTHRHSICPGLCGAQSVTDGGCEASWIYKLWPMDIASLNNYNIHIGYSWSHGDGPCITWALDGQMCIFNNISHVKAIYQPILFCVCCFWISVSK
jgi:hypothetical protein